MTRALLLLALALAACDVGGTKTTNNTNNINNTNNTNNTNNINNTNNGTCDPIAVLTTGSRLALHTGNADNGGLSVLDLSVDPVTLAADVAVVHSDSTVRAGNDRLYVVGRLGGDSLLALDDETFAVQWQLPLPAGSNPQDIALVSTCKAYVSLYQKNFLQIVNPTTGTADPQAVVPLAAFADADGLPEASFLLAHGDRVYVAVQYLVDWTASRDGRLLVVNPAFDGVETEIGLNSPNPFSPIVAVDDTHMAVGCVGDFSGYQGGIEVIDTASGTARLAVSSEALGGVVTDLVFEDAECGFALVNTPEWTSGVRRFCLDDGQGGPGAAGDWLVAPGPYTVVGLALVDDVLYFADATAAAPGVRFVDLALPEAVSERLATGLPPGFAKPFTLLP